MKTKRYAKNILMYFMVGVLSFSALGCSNISIENTKDESSEEVVDLDISESIETDIPEYSSVKTASLTEIATGSPTEIATGSATATIIGSARKDERGKYSGGKAGDSTGKEVSTQNYYSNNWIVIRAKSVTQANKIADAMQKACDNNRIGYDQSNRNSVINACKNKGYDPSKITTNVEADCSSLVRLCCLYAGINVGNFNTANEKDVLSQTGEFNIIENWTSLQRGDILVTKTKGHTAVVVSGNSYNSSGCPFEEPSVNLKEGSKGEGVKWLQWNLNKLIDKDIISGQKLDVDGDWGGKTSQIFYQFQYQYPDTGTNGEPDGVCGPKAIQKLQILNAPECEYEEPSVNLKEGSKGEGVKWLQWYLNKLIDEDIISGQKLDVDGDWGGKTSEIFYQFQKKYPDTGTNGKPDGVCGPKARQKLKSLV